MLSRRSERAKWEVEIFLHIPDSNPHFSRAHSVGERPTYGHVLWECEEYDDVDRWAHQRIRLKIHCIYFYYIINSLSLWSNDYLERWTLCIVDTDNLLFPIPLDFCRTPNRCFDTCFSFLEHSRKSLVACHGLIKPRRFSHQTLSHFPALSPCLTVKKRSF